MGKRKGIYTAGVFLAAVVVLGVYASRAQSFSLPEPLPQSVPQAQQLLTKQLAGGPKPTSQPQAIIATIVRTLPVQRGPISQVLSYTGDVRPKAQVAIIPKLAGRIETLDVNVGDTVRAGQQLAALDHEILDAQVAQAQSGVAVAQAKLASMEAGPRAEAVVQAAANVDAAKERLALMAEGGRGESIAQADAAVRLAEAKLAQLRAGATAEQIEQAQAAVRAANNQLSAVQAQADSAMGRMGSGFTQQMKDAQSGAAYEQARIAEARLAELQAGSTPEQLAQAQAAVDQASAALELARNPFTSHDLKQAENAVLAAEQQLLLVQNPYTHNDLAAARATVAQAEAAVQLASLQRKNAVITSPVSGIVLDRFVSMGDMASPTSPIMTIQGSEGIEVQVAVEEAMFSVVSVGKPVTVTVASYPGVAMEGKVMSVSPSLDPKTRASMVKIEVNDKESPLKPGMFAQASIVAASREDALLVPKRAVFDRNLKHLVFLVVDGIAVLREVQTGLNDGANFEITSGLKAGDSVIVSNLADLADGDPVQAAGNSR